MWYEGLQILSELWGGSKIGQKSRMRVACRLLLVQLSHNPEIMVMINVLGRSGSHNVLFSHANGCFPQYRYGVVRCGTKAEIWKVHKNLTTTLWPKKICECVHTT